MARSFSSRLRPWRQRSWQQQPIGWSAESVFTLKSKLPRRPAREGLTESDNARVIGSLDERLIDGHRIIGRNRSQGDFRLDSASRSANHEASDHRVLRRAPWPRAAGTRGKIDPVDPDLENCGISVASG